MDEALKILNDYLDYGVGYYVIRDGVMVHIPYEEATAKDE